MNIKPITVRKLCSHNLILSRNLCSFFASAKNEPRNRLRDSAPKNPAHLACAPRSRMAKSHAAATAPSFCVCPRQMREQTQRSPYGKNIKFLRAVLLMLQLCTAAFAEDKDGQKKTNNKLIKVRNLCSHHLNHPPRKEHHYELSPLRYPYLPRRSLLRL